ncbi:MAG: transposase [Desulfohalobium sp.]
MNLQDVIAQCGVQRVFRARYKVDEPGYVSHITQRAAGREPLFVEDDDYLTMLGLLKESAQKFQLCYYALCLMSNHVHLLLEPQERNLAEAMRSIFSRYAAKFNRKYERRGHLFGGPYRQSICLDSTYLVTASVYIHLNPVRAGLCESPSDYRWTSSALYCPGVSRESFIDPGPILQLVDEEESSARKEYAQLLQQARGAEPDNALEQEGAIERFCMRLAEKFPALFGRLSGNGTKTTAQNPPLLELTQLERLLREASGDRSRKPESRQAKKYVVEQLLARGYKKTEIAARLGISRKTVYNILTQV